MTVRQPKMHTIQLSTKQVEEFIDGVAITLTKLHSDLEIVDVFSKDPDFTPNQEYIDYIKQNIELYQDIYKVLDKALQEVETTNEH